MKPISFYVLSIAAVGLLLLAGCMSSAYNTSGYRTDSMQGGNIALAPDGLTQAQIDAILATDFPPNKAVSLTLFYLKPPSYGEAAAFDPMPAIIGKLLGNRRIDRIVPVPGILVPNPLSIDAIQQIGIRTQSEYSLIFFGDAGRTFFSYKSPLGHYMISSTLEYLLIDNRTTAIITADKLFSEFQVPVAIWNDKQYQLAKQQMYEEQAALFSKKLDALFGAQEGD